MNNNKALEFANDFIKNSIFTKTNIKLDKPFETIFNDEILENDPNLKILKT